MNKEETIEEAAYQARRDYQDEVGKDGMNECIMFDAMKIEKGFELGAKWQQARTCKHSYVLTDEQGHRVIKCSKCNDTQPI